MSTLYRLSSEYDLLYKKNIIQFQKNIIEEYVGDEFFLDFYPSLGQPLSERCDIIFYGQAVNGWCSGFDLHEKIDDLKIENSIIASNSRLEKLNHSPLDWVNITWSKSTFDAATKDIDAKTFYTTSPPPNCKTSSSFFLESSLQIDQ